MLISSGRNSKNMCFVETKTMHSFLRSSILSLLCLQQVFVCLCLSVSLNGCLGVIGGPFETIPFLV